MISDRSVRLIEAMRRVNGIVRSSLVQLQLAGVKHPMDVFHWVEYTLFAGDLRKTHSFICYAGRSKLHEIEAAVDRDPVFRFKRGLHDARQRVKEMLVQVKAPVREHDDRVTIGEEPEKPVVVCNDIVAATNGPAAFRGGDVNAN